MFNHHRKNIQKQRKNVEQSMICVDSFFILSSFCHMPNGEITKWAFKVSPSCLGVVTWWVHPCVLPTKKTYPKNFKDDPPPPKKKNKEKEVCNIFSKSGYWIHFFKTKESTTSLPKPVAPRNSDQNDGPSEENTHHRDQSPNFLWSACKLLQVVVSPLQKKHVHVEIALLMIIWV